MVKYFNLPLSILKYFRSTLYPDLKTLCTYGRRTFKEWPKGAAIVELDTRWRCLDNFTIRSCEGTETPLLGP